MDFFNTLDPLLKVLWFIAIPTSLIFCIQSIMTFAGMDASDGIDADFDSNLNDTEAPFQLFTFRNLIHFFLGFSWSGISFYGVISNKAALVTICTIAGIAFIVVFFLIIKQIQKLAEDNSFRIVSTLQKTGFVYLAIPGKKQGKGKVQVSVNGTVHELDAITENERIETNSPIRVIRVEGSDLVVVERL